MPEWEKRVLLGYLLNLLKASGGRTDVAKTVCRFLLSNEWLLGNDHWAFSEMLDSHLKERTINELPIRSLKELLADLGGIITRQQVKLGRNRKSLLEQNLRLLTGHLGLDAVEAAFIGLVVRHQDHTAFTSILNELTGKQLRTLDASAICLGITMNSLLEKLRPAGKLLSSGIIYPAARSGTDLDDHYRITDTVHNALNHNHGGLDCLLTAMLGEPCEASLSWDDFDHLRDIGERLTTFLRQAVHENITGVNILLWGAPGTGKTEFCKSLAAEIGLKLYTVMEKDDQGDEPTRRDRLTFYRLAQNLLRSQGDSLLMFDEMDDLFENPLMRLFGKKPAFASKVFMNRAIENNPVPTLWLINDVTILDEAFIRRMSLAIEIKSPPACNRERVWKRVLLKNELQIAADDLKKLVELNISPAVFDNAARFTASISGTADDFHFATQGILHAMRGGRPLPRPEISEVFLPELTCVDLDLDLLTERLCLAPSRAFSLCLYGPPGTGKSAYLRHLADKLGMPVLCKRASDLLGKYVGESEKGIAAAFQEAIDREALLIFDEADSLLGDRRHARLSWEISQVNEMLTWMERHPLPFACTTNLRERLDPASLRRFTFKCKFDYLSQQQALQAFGHFFGSNLPTSKEQQLAALTPGDFAVVRRKAEILGLLDDHQALSELLREEVKVRGGSESKRIGFT